MLQLCGVFLHNRSMLEQIKRNNKESESVCVCERERERERERQTEIEMGRMKGRE